MVPHGYYTYDLLGVHVDESVLADLLAQKLPKIAAHLERVETKLSAIVTPWLMCLFINVLPFEVRPSSLSLSLLSFGRLVY